ncbi:MAG: MipA/OmpV family protein [Azospirillaceae bacterium]|nr:MipA/OmpV family protein [Azospirillaceae bacterium]
MRTVFRPMTRYGILAAVLAATPAFAQEQPGAQPRSTWDFTVGAGAMARPTYEGSDHYTVSPIPLIDIKWNDMVEMGQQGIAAYWHQGALKVGVALAFDPGRDDSKNFFNQGDDRLKGLGNIDLSTGVKVFGSYQLGRLSFNASATKFNGSQNDGVVANVGVGLPLRLADGIILTPHVGATWANDNYMETFFGVTPTQAARSIFTSYTADAGFKDVTVGANLRYRITEHWFAMTDVSVKKLLGSAADSPLTYSATNAVFMAGVGYHF